MLKHIFVILTQWEYDNQSVRRLRGAGPHLSYVLGNRAVIETGGQATLLVQPFPTVYNVRSTVWTSTMRNLRTLPREDQESEGLLRRSETSDLNKLFHEWGGSYPDLASLAADGYKADLT